MRYFTIALGLMAFLMARPVCAADAPKGAASADKVTVRTSVTDREVRDYRVDVSIKGTMPNPDTGQSMDVDTSMSFKIRHRYIKRERDGLLPMEVTMLEGVVTLDGQKITIAPSIYPKSTVLLDKNFRIDDVFGYSETTPNALPGINYGNMIMLFYLTGPSAPRAVGDTWDTRIILPALKEAYTVKNTLKSISKPEVAPATGTVKQDITRVSMPNSTTPPPSMKAGVESTFTQDTGKLTASHVECEVNIPRPSGASKDPKSKQDNQPYRANIRMDISLVK